MNRLSLLIVSLLITSPVFSEKLAYVGYTFDKDTYCALEVFYPGEGENQESIKSRIHFYYGRLNADSAMVDWAPSIFNVYAKTNFEPIFTIIPDRFNKYVHSNNNNWGHPLTTTIYKKEKRTELNNNEELRYFAFPILFNQKSVRVKLNYYYEDDKLTEVGVMGPENKELYTCLIEEMITP